MRAGERGFVFAAVAAVLVLLSALLAGAFFYALQEERLGRSGQATVRALAASEAGAAAAIAQWSPAREGALLPGDALGVTVNLPEGAGSASATVTAWGERIMLVRSRGTDPTASAAREVAVLVRLALPAVLTPAALAVTAAATMDLADHVDSSDYRLTDWRCQEPPTDVPAALSPWPEPWSDWDSLAARAVTGPVLPDAQHPVIRVPGDLDLVGGSGTGILLVEGDATIAGGAMVTGLLLVRGGLEFRGTGGLVIGAVRAGAIAAQPTALAGGPLVKWSSCAVLRARRAAARPVLVRGWSWVDLSGGW
jgi:hypothetical protein